MSDIFLIRGLPYTGKSDFANHLAMDTRIRAVVIETDTYFKTIAQSVSLADRYSNPEYENGHFWARRMMSDARQRGRNVAIVDNFARYDWMHDYFRFANENDNVYIIICNNTRKNEFPADVREKIKQAWMKRDTVMAKWQWNWGSGNRRVPQYMNARTFELHA